MDVNTLAVLKIAAIEKDAKYKIAPIKQRQI